MTGTGLLLDRVTISLRGHALLSLTHAVGPGEVLTVMGPSGSGKSTLLAYVGGFLDPAFEATGTVLVDGTDISRQPAEQRHAGLLFQDALLFPHMTVGGNVAFALPAQVKGRAGRRARAAAALADVGLEGFAERDPETLSGGQKARVALARTLVSAPRLLLLDEPFSRLDADLRQQMRDLVFLKAKASRLPVVLVTHDEADAAVAGGPVVRIGT
jgi:putative thiamine transport system ATP-binding protein